MKRPRLVCSLTLLGPALVLAMACSGAQQTGPHAAPEPEAASAGEVAAPPAGEPSAPPATVLPKVSQREHPAGQAWVFEAGAEPRKQEIAQAEAAGYTVIDLGNSWVPYIFSEKTTGVEDLSANEYRQRYIDLANDRVDADGEKLDPHERNFLELYGIPPTLQVVHGEWQDSDAEIEPCLTQAGFDPAVFTRFSGVIAYTGKKGGDVRKARALKAKLAKDMKKAGLDPATPEAAKDHPKLGATYASWLETQARVDVIDHAQRRLRCEKMFVSAEGVGKYEPGVFDSATTHALAAFEKKHAIKGWGHFTPDNLAALARSQAESMHGRMLRVIEERTVSGASILEDGSAAKWKPKFRWTDSQGQEHALRDVVGEARTAVVAALDLATPESAKQTLARLSDLGGGNFDNLLVAVRLPPPPAYYAEDMSFDVVIDRGDVWYDFPFDAQGNKLGQPRERYPHFTIYAVVGEQKIPLVHWRTTIGSWRSEMYNGSEHYKYKESDVGDRVWKEIVAAPVWIPPATTPARELVRRKWKDGKVRTVVNYGEFGPSYTSAYGLVAAYHVREVTDAKGEVKDFDNGIRTHGSVDYMSILRRFSHGCHRLYNISAVRMFSFILAHRGFTREGQVKLGFGREIVHEGKPYKIQLKTRGYRYSLQQPIAVHVLEGRIRGDRKSPIDAYIPKPTKAEAPADALTTEAPPELTPNLATDVAPGSP
ncbi:hypothetical protein [Nannocystis sp.]|uniref:hypothetical protein n=1 Tax=Nannocystis sp. TaxID=1962667 RepID=UPI0025E225BF|nr:hypothetical protein [Nannocystis sp.]MBK7829906.1 hypothetical protein [Nannocystis sp.]